MLAMHKDVQNKVVQELRQVLGDSKDIPSITFETQNKLTYLEMVINETMRLLPLVTYLLRQTNKDFKLADYLIPQGAILVLPIFKIHRDKKLWGEDALIFNPDRFEKENFKKIHPYAFMPFGSN
jgi:cytochrome P450 family 313